MLKSTFIHVPCIGNTTEENLWKSDILTWKDFFSRYKSLRLSEQKKRQMMHYLKFSDKELSGLKHNFFSANLAADQHWRAYPDFRERCAFLDIETTGLDKHRNRLTVVGIFDGKKSKVYINGINMDEFEKDIKKYSLIVTFNGKCFDLPFLQQKYPDIDFDMLHVDLRFLLRKLGYTGGLKRIEKDVGIVRGDDIKDVDGYEAVRLWHNYERGSRDALRTLVDYNIADIENLKALMDLAFDRAKDEFYYSKLG